MEKIRITRNVKRIEVNDAGEYIELDFDDLNLPYRYYDMLKQLKEKRMEINNRLEALKDKTDSERAAEIVEVERETNIYFRDAIDKVFGEGTCRKLYGDILPTLELHLQFFDLIAPYFAAEAENRRRKMNKYNAGRTGNA